MRRAVAFGMAAMMSFGSVPVYAQSAMLTDLKGFVLLSRGKGLCRCRRRLNYRLGIGWWSAMLQKRDWSTVTAAASN